MPPLSVTVLDGFEIVPLTAQECAMFDAAREQWLAIPDGDSSKREAELRMDGMVAAVAHLKGLGPEWRLARDPRLGWCLVAPAGTPR